MTFSDTNDINHLVLSENITDRKWFFKVILCPINFIRDGSTVNLEFHNMSFLLFQTDKFLLGVNKNTDDFAVLLHFLKITFNTLLTIIIRPFLAGFVESLSL